jgi:MFS transporter, PAT family, beta-lactamase induction signal transducer AmpG
MSSRRFRYALLFALALTEVLPIALLSTALPVLLRRGGATMAEIGVVFLAMFPWSLKALWAPLIDCLGIGSSVQRYRGWLLVTHPLLLILLVTGSFWDIPALLLHDRGTAMPALLLLTAICAAADAASHGLAVNLLRPEERGPGNGLQTAGLMTGQLIGGGLMVIFVDSFGWQTALQLIAAILMVPLPALVLYRERLAAPTRTVRFTEMLALFRQPRMARWLLVVAAIPLGASVMGPALEVVLVDRGYALKEIGLVMSVLASLAGIGGGLLGGIIIHRIGRRRAFHTLLVVSTACLAMVLLNGLADGRPLLYLVVVVPNIGIMARATLLHALMMDRCRPHVASTDFTVQYTVQHLSRFAALSGGAFIAGWFGPTFVFVLAPVLTLGALALASRLLVPADFQPPTADR